MITSYCINNDCSGLITKVHMVSHINFVLLFYLLKKNYCNLETANVSYSTFFLMISPSAFNVFFTIQNVLLLTALELANTRQRFSF